jgi:hypothetical protein
MPPFSRSAEAESLNEEDIWSRLHGQSGVVVHLGRGGGGGRECLRQNYNGTIDDTLCTRGLQISSHTHASLEHLVLEPRRLAFM